MSEEQAGKWVRNEDMNPLTNVYGRKWRCAYLDGSIRTGTYYGPDMFPPPNPRTVEWFFPSE